MYTLTTFFFGCYFLVFVNSTNITISPAELSGLEFVYNSTNGLSWNWDSDLQGHHWDFPPTTDPCGSIPWQGLNCSCMGSTECTVVAIDLPSYNLNGSIPSEVSLLANLTLLRVSDNYLSGSSLSFICGLPLLSFLGVDGCSLAGTIPSCIVNLVHLEVLQLAFNMFTGSIPQNIGALQNLEVFNIGPMPDCTSKTISASCQAPESTNYAFDRYRINGTLPTSICKLTGLLSLNIGLQNIGGTIPSCIGNMSSLNSLLMPGNFLLGSIPSEIGLLSDLAMLVLDDNLLRGFIPSSLGLLTNLIVLSMNANRFTGSLSMSLCQLQDMQVFDLGFNQLSGSIPSCIGQLTATTKLNLAFGSLVGSIPWELGSMVSLQLLYLTANDITGTIPSSIVKLTNLETIGLNYNQISGAIPPRLPSSLLHIWFQNNNLHGSIPSSIGALTSLLEVVMDENYLTGTLPDSISNLDNLIYLNISVNSLTGTVPTSMGMMSTLYFLYLNGNEFSGSGNGVFDFVAPNVIDLELSQNMYSQQLPYGLTGRNVQNCYLRDNYFSGTIPVQIPFLESIIKLDLGDNHFSGTLPLALHTITALAVLIVSGNKFYGGLNDFFSNTSYNNHLVTVDVSHNGFTGSLPYNLFLSSSLQEFAAGSNCFSGTLSNDLCNARNLTTLDLSGLTSGASCEVSVSLFGPFKYLTSNPLKGTIPSCLFSSTSLVVLSLSGMNIHSTLSDIALDSHLRHLILSYNHITGSIPLSIKSYSRFANLDLSYNRLSGTLDDAAWLSHDDLGTEPAAVILQSNRLSGSIPPTFINAPEINILNGNMFQCEQLNSQHTLPQNDPYASKYFCGSNSVNTAFFAAASAVMFGLCIGTISMFTAASDNTARRYIVQLWRMWFEIYEEYSCPLVDLVGEMLSVLRMSAQKWLVAILLLVPLYILLKQSGGFRTHTYEYSWLVSMGYMDGVLPATVIFAIWLVMLPLFIIDDILASRKFRKLGNTANSNTFADQRRSEFQTANFHTDAATNPTATQQYENRKKRAILILVLFLNFVIIFTANSVYVYVVLNMSVIRQHIASFALSLFKLVWTNAVMNPIVRRLSSRPKLVLVVSVVNNVLIPLLGTLIIDVDCYQKIFFPPSLVSNDLIVQNYQCSLGVDRDGMNSTTCIYTPYLESSSFEPPFSYSGQCGSSLLTNYIQVYVILYGVYNGIVMFAQFLVFCYFHDVVAQETRNIDAASDVAHANDNKDWRVATLLEWKTHIQFYSIITVGVINQRVLPIQEGDDLMKYADPKCIKTLYSLREFGAGFVLGMLLLLTFGVGYPPLAIVIFLDIAALSLLQQLFITSHYKQIQHLARKNKFLLDIWTKVLEMEVEQLRIMLFNPMPLSVVFSTIFVSLFIYDMLDGSDSDLGPIYICVLFGWSCLLAIVYHYYEEHIKKHSLTVSVDLFVRNKSVDAVEFVNRIFAHTSLIEREEMSLEEEEPKPIVINSGCNDNDTETRGNVESGVINIDSCSNPMIK